MKIFQKLLPFVIVLSLASCNPGNFYIIPFKRYIVAENGMYPSIEPKNTFWIKRKPLFKCENINRGDIVVFYYKEDQATYNYIWRVIGIPGDKIRIEGKSVFVNNQLLKQEKTKESADQIIYSENGTNIDYFVAYDKIPKPSQRVDIDIVVTREHLFLLGDNRDNAMDSRFKGLVPFSDVIGIKM